MAYSDIVKKWRSCEGCQLAQGRSRVVVGELYVDQNKYTKGDPILLVVGEAPGRREDQMGRPFVGPSGTILREEVLPASDIHAAVITNVVACRPPQNRDPAADEIQACAPRLVEIRQAVRPAGAVLVGRVAARAAVAGGWMAGLPSVAIRHPAWYLRQGHPTQHTRTKLSEDIAKVQQFLRKLVKDKDKNSICQHVPKVIGKWRRAIGKSKVANIVICDQCSSMLNVPWKRS